MDETNVIIFNIIHLKFINFLLKYKMYRLKLDISHNQKARKHILINIKLVYLQIDKNN